MADESVRSELERLKTKYKSQAWDGGKGWLSNTDEQPKSELREIFIKPVVDLNERERKMSQRFQPKPKAEERIRVTPNIPPGVQLDPQGYSATGFHQKGWTDGLWRLTPAQVQKLPRRTMINGTSGPPVVVGRDAISPQTDARGFSFYGLLPYQAVPLIKDNEKKPPTSQR